MLPSFALDRRSAVAGALALGTCFLNSSIPFAQAQMPQLGGTLRERGARKGLLVGTTFDREQFNDARMIEAITRDYDALVPGNGLNWTRTQPQPNGPLNFSEVYPVMQLAQKINAKFRLHDLVYHATTPQWVKDLVPTLSVAATEQLLTGYIRDVLTAVGGNAVHIHVVNEPAHDASPVWPRFVFQERLGFNYLDIAFHAAHEAAPHATLFVNDAVLEPGDRYFDTRRDGMLRLLDGMLSRGVPVHALGLEGHLMTERSFSQTKLANFIEQVTGMGLKVMVTELDVNDRAIAGNVAMRDEGAAALAKAFLDVMFSFRQCLGMLTWNGCDRYSWLRQMTMVGDAPGKRQRADHQPLRPTPLDDNYQHKPMWNAIALALDNAPAR